MMNSIARIFFVGRRSGWIYRFYLTMSDISSKFAAESIHPDTSSDTEATACPIYCETATFYPIRHHLHGVRFPVICRRDTLYQHARRLVEPAGL